MKAALSMIVALGVGALLAACFVQPGPGGGAYIAPIEVAHHMHPHGHPHPMGAHHHHPHAHPHYGAPNHHHAY